MALVESYFTTAAGEFYVAYKLALLGLLPAFPRNSVRSVDLVVSNSSGAHAVGVVICTVATATRDLRRSLPTDPFTIDFPLSHRAVVDAPDSAIFCLVDLMMRTPGAYPEVFVIPAAILKRDVIGAPARKYAYTRYKRSRQAMEYYRNNWRPFLDSLKCDFRGQGSRTSPRPLEPQQTNYRAVAAMPVSAPETA